MITFEEFVPIFSHTLFSTIYFSHIPVVSHSENLCCKIKYYHSLTNLQFTPFSCLQYWEMSYCCFSGRESFMSDSVTYPPWQAFLYSHGQRLRRVLNHPALLAREVHGHQWILWDASLKFHTCIEMLFLDRLWVYVCLNDTSVCCFIFSWHKKNYSTKICIVQNTQRFFGFLCILWTDFGCLVVLYCHLVSE